MLYPLKFNPVLKEKLWGGNSLQVKYGMELPSQNIGESWNIASHENGMSRVANGEFMGKTIEDLIQEYGHELLGTKIVQGGFNKFPLLIKLLDATDVLSVQVHPDDDYASGREMGELGKTEMWYIIDAKKGASIIYGIETDVTRDQFRHSIETMDVGKHLKSLEVESGDVIYIPAGMVHAIGQGILLCEIQQNSDTTYRVYDWDRVDEAGHPRELHIDRALEVIDFQGSYHRDRLEGLTVYRGQNSITYYIATEHFAVEKLDIREELRCYADGRKFFTLTNVEGEGHIYYRDSGIELRGGESILIPANPGEYEIVGNCTLIRAYIPEVERDVISPLLNSGFSKYDLERVVGISI